MYMRNEIKNEEEQKLWKETIISGIALWIVLAVFMATNVNVHDFIFMMILNTMLIALGIFCYIQKTPVFASMIQMAAYYFLVFIFVGSSLKKGPSGLFFYI